MKKFITVFLVIFSFLFGSKVNCQWGLNFIMSSDENLTYLCTVDTFSVWGVGGKGFWHTDTAIIYKMVPQGIWKMLPMQDFMYKTRISCIAATDTTNAFIGTYDAKIYRTSDGGYNWNVVFDFGGEGFINDIKFSRINNLIGYANCDPPGGVGTAFKILKTVNGGLNWSLYSPTVSGNYVGMAISSCVTDSNHYWMGLNCQNSACSVPKILFTTDGGINWQTTTINHPADYVIPIEFSSDNQTGYCCSFGVIVQQVMHKSTNGGFIWSNYYLLPIQQDQLINTMYWIEGTTDWYFSNSNYNEPQIYKSTDNGVSWNAMEIDLYNDQIEYMSLIKKNNKVWGYASTTNSQIFELLGDSLNPVRIKNIERTIPEKFILYQNYPNPFNPTTKIKFDIPSLGSPLTKGGLRGVVTLKVYNILGKEIETLVNEKLNPGSYEVTFNASQYPSGVYFYRLQVGDYNETKKMLLIK